jgi:hypothetical protein
VVSQGLHNVCNSGSLLTDGNVNAVELSGFFSSWVVEGSFLVNDGINGDGSLSSLSVTNDQFSLTSSNWNLFVIHELKID